MLHTCPTGPVLQFAAEVQLNLRSANACRVAAEVRSVGMRSSAVPVLRVVGPVPLHSTNQAAAPRHLCQFDSPRFTMAAGGTGLISSLSALRFLHSDPSRVTSSVPPLFSAMIISEDACHVHGRAATPRGALHTFPLSIMHWIFQYGSRVRILFGKCRSLLLYVSIVQMRTQLTGRRQDTWRAQSAP